MGVLDVQHVRVDLGPAASDRTRRHVGEVVLQPAGETVGDVGRHLLRERGRRVGTGEDEVDLAEDVAHRATALVPVVHEVVGVEGGTRRDPGGRGGGHGRTVIPGRPRLVRTTPGTEVPASPEPPARRRRSAVAILVARALARSAVGPRKWSSTVPVKSSSQRSKCASVNGVATWTGWWARSGLPVYVAFAEQLPAPEVGQPVDVRRPVDAGGGEDRPEPVVHRRVAVERADQPLDVVTAAQVRAVVDHGSSRRSMRSTIGNRTLFSLCTCRWVSASSSASPR